MGFFIIGKLALIGLMSVSFIRLCRNKHAMVFLKFHKLMGDTHDVHYEGGGG